MSVGQFLIRVVMAAAIVFTLRQIASHITAERNLHVLEVLSNGATRINQQAPIPAGEGIQLDRAQAGPGKKITYFYTFTNLDGRDMSDPMITDFMKKLEHSLLDEYNNSEELKVMKANEVDMIYNYRDRMGQHMFDIQVGPKR